MCVIFSGLCTAGFLLFQTAREYALIYLIYLFILIIVMVLVFLPTCLMTNLYDSWAKQEEKRTAKETALQSHVLKENLMDWWRKNVYHDLFLKKVEMSHDLDELMKPLFVCGTEARDGSIKYPLPM